MRHRPVSPFGFQGKRSARVSYWLRVKELELVSVSVGRTGSLSGAGERVGQLHICMCTHLHIKSGAGERVGQLHICMCTHIHIKSGAGERVGQLHICMCTHIHIKSGAGERVGQLTPACQTAMETGVCVTQCVLALTHGMGEEACAAC